MPVGLVFFLVLAIEADLLLCARLQPVGGSGVQLHPFGQRDGRGLDVCLCELAGLQGALLGQFDAERSVLWVCWLMSCVLAGGLLRLPVRAARLIVGSNGSSLQPSRRLQRFS